MLTHSLVSGCDQPRRDSQCQGCERGAGACGPVGSKGGFLRLPPRLGGTERLGAHPFVVSRASWCQGWGSSEGRRRCQRSRAAGSHGARRAEENGPHALWTVDQFAEAGRKDAGAARQGQGGPRRGFGDGAPGTWMTLSPGSENLLRAPAPRAFASRRAEGAGPPPSRCGAASKAARAGTAAGRDSGRAARAAGARGTNPRGSGASRGGE